MFRQHSRETLSQPYAAEEMASLPQIARKISWSVILLCAGYELPVTILSPRLV
jgi:hypothetical protein